MSLGLQVSMETTGGNKGFGILKAVRDQDSLRDLFSAAIATAMGQSAQVRPADVVPGHPAEADGPVGLVSGGACGQAGELPNSLAAKALSVGDGVERTSPPAPDEAFLVGVNAPLTEGEDVLSVGPASILVTGSAAQSMPAGAPRETLSQTDLDRMGTSLFLGEATPGRSAVAARSAIQGTAASVDSFPGTAAEEVAAADSLAEVPSESGTMERALKARSQDVTPKPTGAVAAAPDVRVVLRQAERMARGSGKGAARTGVSPSEPQEPSAEAVSEAARIKLDAGHDDVHAEDSTITGDGEPSAAQLPDRLSEDALTHAFERAASQVSGRSDQRLEQVDQRLEQVDRPPVSLGDVRAVADRIREEALKRLPRSVEIRLDPPELGKVTVLLSTRGQDVAVKFVAAASETQRVLSQASGDLAQALSERGLTLTGFSVDQGARDSASQAQAHAVWLSERSKVSKRSGVDLLVARATIVAPRHASGVCDYFA